MAWTQSDVDKLQAAIGSGLKSVTYEGKGSKTYQDTASMMAALKEMKAEVATAGGRVRTRLVRITTGSGY